MNFFLLIEKALICNLEKKRTTKSVSELFLKTFWNAELFKVLKNFFSIVRRQIFELPLIITITTHIYYCNAFFGP